MNGFQRLAGTDLGRAESALSLLDNHLAVRSILSGITPGQVYVDDSNQPHAALAFWRHRFYLGGLPSMETAEGLRRLFADKIFPGALAAGTPDLYMLHFEPASWTPHVEIILQGKDPIWDRHCYLECREPNQEWPSLLPEGYILRQVDAQLLSQPLARRDSLREEMGSERGSVADFLAHSFGVCLVHDATIVGWCLSEFNVEDRCEVGIEVYEPYRRRGLGTAMAMALVEQARARGIACVGWHCWAGNRASAATALKAGFELVEEIPVVFGWFDPVDNLAVNGNVCLRRGAFGEAVSWFERAIQAGGQWPWLFWNAACACAETGQVDQALRYVRGAVSYGFDDLERMRSSEPFTSLLGTHAWQAFLDDLEVQTTEPERAPQRSSAH